MLYEQSRSEFAYRAAENMMISVRTLHQRLDHSEKRKLIQMKNNVKNLEIIDIKDFLNNCRICIKKKKIKKVRFDNSKKFKFLTENNENKKIEFEFIISYTHK